MYLRQTLYLLQITQFEVSCLDFNLYYSENHKVSFTNSPIAQFILPRTASDWLDYWMKEPWWYIAIGDTFVCFAGDLERLSGAT